MDRIKLKQHGAGLSCGLARHRRVRSATSSRRRLSSAGRLCRADAERLSKIAHIIPMTMAYTDPLDAKCQKAFAALQTRAEAVGA
jgi:hypothetical protein